MSGSVKDLIVRLLVDDAELDKVDKSKDRFDKWGSALDTASRGASIALGGIAAAAFATGQQAADAEQAMGAVDSVFGTYAGRIHEYAGLASGAVGLSATEYSTLASILGAQLKNMGTAAEDLVPRTDSLIQTGADLSAMFGGTASDAVAALSSLLRGETDPIEAYGVSIKEADIAAKLAAMGLEGLEGDAAKAARTQALLALVTDQTAAAQGQFARESDTAAGAQQRAKASWADASAELGTVMLPIMRDMATGFRDFSGWVKENAGLVQTLAVVVGGLAVGILTINGITKTFAAVQAIQTAAQWASNAAWLASPTTWIILAIVAAIGLLVLAGIWLVQNWDGVVKWFGEAWQNILNGANEFMGWIGDLFLNWSPLGIIINNWGAISEWFEGWWGDLLDNIGEGADWVGDRVDDVVGFFSSIPDRIGAAWDGLLNIVKNVVHGIAVFTANLWNSTLGRINFALPWFMGGGQVKFPRLTIPALAEGGIVTSPTLALIGEAGPEAVVPLSRYDRGGGDGRYYADVPVVMQIDGREVAREIRRVEIRRKF